MMLQTALTIRLTALLAAFFLSHAAFAADVKGEVPYREDSGLTKAEYYIAREKYAEAIDETNNVLKRHPKSADAYTYRGVAYQRLGDSGKARENFRKALQASPTHLGANKYMAEMLLDDGDVALAVEQMQVLRAVCGASDCEELDDLERDINDAKAGKRKKDKKEASAPVRGEAGEE